MDEGESSASERRDAEVHLLQAMYPDQVSWSSHSSELKYSSEEGGTLILRLPETYPGRGLPEIISATDSHKSDIRQRVKEEIIKLHLSEGEEVLDAIITCYQEVFQDQGNGVIPYTDRQHYDKESGSERKMKTVIIWLHHLLATSKRKLALNPSVDAQHISGITKPGYPGILVFSGLSHAVDAHVSELKDQRWQAFQVRFEEEYDTDSVGHCLEFEHGSGVKEVETMSEVVQGIIGEDNRQAFLKAVGVK